VPQAPNVDGLPVWLQVLVSVAFVLATMFVAAQGYRRRLEREPPGAGQTVLAAFPDMSAVRQLTDMCRVLSGEVQKLDSSMIDHTHYMRDKIEVDRELCMRLRELREEIIRSDRQRATRG
jgi:hypothetical protein